MISPKEYTFWLSYDEAFIYHWAEAILRLEGSSNGADREVKIALELSLPVYYSIEEII